MADAAVHIGLQPVAQIPLRMNGAKSNSFHVVPPKKKRPSPKQTAVFSIISAAFLEYKE